jgi:hypothetical protein
MPWPVARFECLLGAAKGARHHRQAQLSVVGISLVPQLTCHAPNFVFCLVYVQALTAFFSALDAAPLHFIGTALQPVRDTDAGHCAEPFVADGATVF